MTTSAFQQALKLHQSGQLAEALAIYRAILKRDPGNFDCLYRQGIALAQMERFEDAARLIGKALKIKPDFAQGHFDLGNLQGRLGRFAQAARSFREAVRLKPDFHAARYNLGNALQSLGRYDDALACFATVLESDPANASALFNRGNAFKALGRFEDAIADYQKVLELQPDFVQAMNNLGNALLQLNRPDDALAQSQAALALRPDHPEYLNNAGLILDELGRLDEALAVYDRAIAARPEYPEAWYNRAITLKKQRRYDEALAAYDRAIKLRPGYPNAIWNRSFCRLLIGDFARGWDGFEERWNNRRPRVEKEEFAPLWDGRKIPGALLVLREQGVGDEIFYSGMLNDLPPLAGSLTVCIDPRLLPLYRRSFSGMTFIGPDDLGGAGHFDAQIHMGSLGQYFRKGPADFARSVRPYLRADEARAGNLRKQIAGDHAFVCGLSWVSKGSGISADKSLALDDLLPLFEMPGTEFVNLQYGDTGDEQARLAARTGRRLVNVPDIDNFNDLDGLAALIEACDAVVTVSNTTAHLAAALGKPVFVMLSHELGLLWYWHVDGSISPWYPGARLFRQACVGDWRGVVGAVRSELISRRGKT